MLPFPSRSGGLRPRAASLLILAGCLAGAGCSSDRKVVDAYTHQAAVAETGDRSTDAEAFYRSALERARALGALEQATAAFNLGRFYREAGRFGEAVAPLREAAGLAPPSGDGALLITRSDVELAKALAALNRWAEGTDALRTAASGVSALSPSEQADVRELVAVYRIRLKELGLDASGLPE